MPLANAPSSGFGALCTLTQRQILQRDARCYKSGNPPNALAREPPHRTGSPTDTVHFSLLRVP